MSIELTTSPLALRVDADGSIRVGDTRVLLDLVIAQYHEGYSAESIVQSYPALQLTDVYGAITYYLTHREEIDEYLRLRGKQAEEIRRQIEADPKHQAIRNRLIAIKSQRPASA